MKRSPIVYKANVASDLSGKPTVIAVNEKGKMMKHLSINIDEISKAPIVRLDGKLVKVNYIEYIHDENTSTVDKARLKIVYFDDDNSMQTLIAESPYELNGEK